MESRWVYCATSFHKVGNSLVKGVLDAAVVVTELQKRLNKTRCFML